MNLTRPIDSLVAGTAADRSAPGPPTGHSVLFVLPWNPDEIGGVSEVVINLFRCVGETASVRPKLMITTQTDHRLASAETRRLGRIDSFYLPNPAGSRGAFRDFLSFAFRLPRSLIQLVGYLRREHVCAINFHYPSLAAVTLLLARRIANRSIRVVLSFHGADLDNVNDGGPLRRWLWRIVTTRCDAVVACSDALAEKIRQTLPEAAPTLHVIHNGVADDDCRATARSTPRPHALSGRRYIANVATFEDKKGQDVLIASFRDLAPTFPDLCLVLVGRSGPTLAAIEAQAAGTGLGDRILIYPDMPHEQTLGVIAGATLFVLPSRKEPFGIVLLEAACLDIPVVASRVDGVPEIVTDGSTGLLVPPDDPEALGQAIRCLLQDSAGAARYARNLKQTVARRFTWDRALRSYAALFGEGGIAR